VTTESRSSRPRLPWILLAVCTVAGGVIGGVIGGEINSPSSSSTATPAASSTQTVPAGQPAADSCSVSAVAQKDLPSVVTISAKGKSAAGTGSGEIIRADGYILTNNHVVAPAVDGGTLAVLFSDGKSAPAQLVGRDPLTDVAVIKVNETQLPAIPVGKSASLIVGQPDIVLGAPLGLSSTVTSGIVSALDRTIQVPGEDGQAALLINAVQTDAAINPGNSGGAMVNCAGQFVGIPSAGATVPSESGEAASAGSIGLGFAIPADLAISEFNEIVATGKVTHAYTGLQATPLEATSQASGAQGGLLVTGIDPAGPAQAAGLRANDIITTINGKPALTTDQIVALMLSEKPGTKVTFGYQRGGQSAQAQLTLASQPAS
jgi:putative serine protease PepD